MPGNPYSSTTQLLIDYLYAYRNADPADARFFATNNLALPADPFRQMGRFNIQHLRIVAGGEDRVLCDRWNSRGYRLTYAPDAVVYHRHRLDLFGFWRQHFLYGRGET